MSSPWLHSSRLYTLHTYQLLFVSLLLWSLSSLTLRLKLRNVILFPHESQPVFRRTLISGQQSHISPDTSFPALQKIYFMLSLWQTSYASIFWAPFIAKSLERDGHIICSACSSPSYSFAKCSLGSVPTALTVGNFVKVTSNFLVTKSCRYATALFYS